MFSASGRLPDPWSSVLGDLRFLHILGLLLKAAENRVHPLPAIDCPLRCWTREWHDCSTVHAVQRYQHGAMNPGATNQRNTEGHRSPA